MTEYDVDRINRRAYEIWDREGRPEGQELEHWCQAERELAAEGNSEAGQGDGAASDHLAASSTNATPADAETSDVGGAAAAAAKKPRASRNPSTDQ